jgi:hypothetical protein
MAVTTTVNFPRSSRSLTRISANIPPRRTPSLLDRLFPRRLTPTLFHRCLAVHIATAGTLSALR